FAAALALAAGIPELAAAIVAVVAPDAVGVQVATTVVVTAAGILLVRPHISSTLARHGGHRGRGVHGGFVGQEVVTIDRVGGPGTPGHVLLAGERWLAVSGADVPLPTGTTVLVTGVEGTTLVVWPADGHLPFDPDGPDGPAMAHGAGEVQNGATDDAPIVDEGER
ncbi:MAG: NfeD family protein, partial [Ilumatobacteraceae bacterium]